MRELLEEWKAAPHAERAAEAVLWKRLSAARNAFTKRRKAYFATLEASARTSGQEGTAGRRGEALSGSVEWGPTTSAFRDLMSRWKAAGRADRDTEAELWKRFRAAQDKFFTARSEVFSAKDAELREHAEAKQVLLDQAQDCCRSPTSAPPGRRCAASRSGGSRSERCRGTPGSSWSQACGGWRTRSARRRKTSGAGPTPKRWREPKAP